jgi:hypothetical protein
MSSQDVIGMDRSARPARPPPSVPGFSVKACNGFIAGWSSPVARQAHNLKVASSNLAPATKPSDRIQMKQPAIGGLFHVLQAAANQGEAAQSHDC